jgi:diguanylate cyclase (GGDEF)-like protein/PAS domain S-box-containing protein
MSGIVARTRAMDPADRDALIRATFEGAPDGIVVLAPDGTALARNARFLALWNFPPDMLARDDSREMREHTAQQLADPQPYRDSLQALLATREPLVLDEHALLDGRVLERHVSPLASPGLPGCIVVRWRDVTARSLAQARQRELTALLDLAMLDANLAYWDVDLRTGQVHSVNGQWHTMLGYGPQDLGDALNVWQDLIHPDDMPQRQAAWDAHVRGDTARYEAEFRMRHREGHWVWILARGQAVARDTQGRATRMVGTRMDISAQKASQQRLTEEAHTDVLTGAANRRHFLERAEDMLRAAQRRGEPMALLMFDLDHFKSINDLLGHAAGDEVLKHSARCARDMMRERDVFGRLGGEEFAALLFDTAREPALAVAQRLLQHVRGHPAAVAGQPVAYTVSVGVTAAEPGGGVQQVDSLLDRADRALYRAKSGGRDRAVLDQPPLLPPSSPPPPA